MIQLWEILIRWMYVKLGCVVFKGKRAFFVLKYNQAYLALENIFKMLLDRFIFVLFKFFEVRRSFH
jgi:hypothetical protein